MVEKQSVWVSAGAVRLLVHEPSVKKWDLSVLGQWIDLPVTMKSLDGTPFQWTAVLRTLRGQGISFPALLWGKAAAHDAAVWARDTWRGLRGHDAPPKDTRPYDWERR